MPRTVVSIRRKQRAEVADFLSMTTLWGAPGIQERIVGRDRHTSQLRKASGVPYKYGTDHVLKWPKELCSSDAKGRTKL